MKRKYNTRCWFCDSTDLKPDDRGINCRSCGATYNILPQPSASPITMREDIIASNYDESRGKSPSPSSILVRQTAKARESQKV